MSIVYMPQGHSSLKSFLCSVAQDWESGQQPICWDGEHSDTSNGTSTVKKYLEPELTTVVSMMHPSLETSENLSQEAMRKPTPAILTLSAPASRSCASHSQQPAPCSEPMIPETCGQRPLNAYASYDHGTHSWRTFQLSLLADISSEYSETWPKWGWMQSGVCFQLAPVVRHIHEKDCSYWPTPTAADHKAGFNNLIEAQRSVSKERRVSGHVVQRRIPYEYLVRYGEPVMTTFYEWLMGIPIGATGLKPLAMDKCRSKSPSHGMYSALNCEVLMEWKEKNLATLSEFLSGLWR